MISVFIFQLDVLANCKHNLNTVSKFALLPTNRQIHKVFNEHILCVSYSGGNYRECQGFSKLQSRYEEFQAFMKDKQAYGLFGQMSYCKYSYFQLRRLYFSHTSLICKFSMLVTLWTMCHLSTKMETQKELTKLMRRGQNRNVLSLLRAHSPSSGL